MMRAFILLLALAGRAQAAGENPAILSADRSVSVSYINTSLYYIEPSGVDAFKTGTNYDDYEKGTIGGAKLAVSWMFPEVGDLYAHLEWSGVDGTVVYTGFTQGNPPSPIFGVASHATIQEYALKVGKGVVTGDRWLLTPYWTLGGRHWVRTLGPGSPFVFVESYNHYYTSLGGLIQYSPASQWVLTGDVSIGRTFAAKINDPADGLNAQMLGSSPIIKLGLEGDWRIDEHVHFFTGVDYMYFAYGQTGVVVKPTFQIIEPNSHTEEYNVNLGVRLSL